MSPIIYLLLVSFEITEAGRWSGIFSAGKAASKVASTGIEIAAKDGVKAMNLAENAAKAGSKTVCI
jgi:hypothetical protein